MWKKLVLIVAMLLTFSAPLMAEPTFLLVEDRVINLDKVDFVSMDNDSVKIYITGVKYEFRGSSANILRSFFSNSQALQKAGIKAIRK